MKLCEMVPFNDKIEGDDCFTLAISNILRYKGFTNYQSVYKQCAIVYYEGENNSLPLIRSRFMNITEELYFGHKIRIKKHKIEQPELFLTLIRSWIKQNEPVLIGVDPFYLPFSLHYQDRHTLHYITAIDFTKNMINIVDDSYNIKQEISDSVLLQ
ncbi:BtrH N-terminal domain-containing protein [Paenibacillus melissococcoides]|nr:BtrH N-terminal domain-containing protein [Paenibacillus melissococcoides]CAH8249554.1 BtrH N-terminal domain-containing protein [Paenibacillus melissococcoides]CAH8721081.1 BtrH N-terminal domain-containing protein [Paenibacillus melissococcoides]